MHSYSRHQFNQFNKSIAVPHPFTLFPLSASPLEPDTGAVPPPAVVALFAPLWWGPMLPSRRSALPILWATVSGLLPVVSIEDTLVVRCMQGRMCGPVRVAVGALEEVELIFRLVLLDDGDSCLWSLDVATLFVAFCRKWR